MIETRELYTGASMFYLGALIISITILIKVGMEEIDEFLGGMLFTVIQSVGCGVLVCLFIINGYSGYAVLSVIHLVIMCGVYLFAISEVLNYKHDEVIIGMFIMVSIVFVTEVILTVGLGDVH